MSQIGVFFISLFISEEWNDRCAVGHDGDGVVVFSLVFQDFLRQLPGFFYGSHGGLVGLFDGFEVFGFGYQDDVVFVGHAEEIEGYEEGDGDSRYLGQLMRLMQFYPNNIRYTIEWTGFGFISFQNIARKN